MKDHQFSYRQKRSFCFQLECSCGWVSKEHMMEVQAKEEAKNHLYIMKQMGEK